MYLDPASKARSVRSMGKAGVGTGSNLRNRRIFEYKKFVRTKIRYSGIHETPLRRA